MTEVFPIAPASTKPLWFIGVISVLLGAVLVMLLYTAWSARHSRVELDGERLRIVGDLWGRSIPLRALHGETARVLDLGLAPEYQPTRRTMGTGLPGWASGWFRLRNGEKALVYLADPRRVAYIPTSEGYALLLGVEEPERLIAAVAARAR